MKYHATYQLIPLNGSLNLIGSLSKISQKYSADHSSGGSGGAVVVVEWWWWGEGGCGIRYGG